MAEEATTSTSVAIAAGTAAAAGAQTVAATPVTPVAGEEYKTMTPAQFAARIAAATAAGASGVHKELGTENIADAKARLADDAKRREAEKSELQRVTETAESLKPKAKRAEILEERIKGYLAIEEAAIPEDKKPMLELAPTEPDARLDWIMRAKGKGLFAAAVAAVAPAEPAKLATSKAAGTPPPPANGTVEKKPKDMNPAEFKAFMAKRNTQKK